MNAPNRRSLTIAVSASLVAFALVGVVLTASGSANSERSRPLQDRKVSADGIWRQIAEPSTAVKSPSTVARWRHGEFQIDRGSLEEILAEAPLESVEPAKESRVVVTLPIPDGSFERFSVVESPIMEPRLARKFPDIKTYLGQGIDDPTAVTRFDWMPSGLHATILSSRDTIIVEPRDITDALNYISYFKQDRPRVGPAPRCLTGDEESARGRTSREGASFSAPSVVTGNGTTLRIYRLAVAATSEYTQAVGGTVDKAMQAITTSINRIDGVFERDFAVRMVLVNNNNKIIYLPGQTEPYTNTDTNACLTQNQQNLDRDDLIGKANYDIGHVFCTANSGLASVGVVCQDGQKAQGVSGGSSPVGDSFDIDLAAQEIGHQFGLNHTFNGSTASCGGNNRNAASAFEPGSGSTIGGYAGTCGSQNLQANTDDYFHVKNIEEVLSYLAASGGCATTTQTGNNPPTVTAGANYTIPRGTPFTLTASANDPDPGDNARLTYAWEEYDLGPQSPPDDDSDGMARPIFRSYRPSSSASRTFPRMDYILQPQTSFDCGLGTNCITGETLPSIARTMNFQVTVRDNHAGGGGVASAQMTLTVDANSGPFVVTAPAAGSAFLPNAPLTVTWNVANTNGAPVNAGNVKISLSLDGGATFTSVADSVPNNGTATVTLPNGTAAKARIKVEAVGNIFFNISPEFSIRPPCAGISVAPAGFPDGAQFQQYNQPITATGGTGALALAITSGSLPAGVQLSNGAVTGVPQNTGSFSFTVTATDSNGCTGATSYTWNVVPSVGVGDGGTGGGGAAAPGGGLRPAAAGSVMTFPVTLSAPSDQPVTVQFSTADGTALSGTNYEPASGTLTFPPGETTEMITVTIIDATAGADCVDFTVDLSDATNALIGDGQGQGDIVENAPADCPDITVGPSTVPPAQVSADYSLTFTASGGALPIQEFDLDGGDLPPGLSLDHASGTLSGKPLGDGTFTFSIAAIDNNNCIGSGDFSLTVAPAPKPITAPSANAMTITTAENTGVSGRLSASNPDGRPLTFSLVDLKDVGSGIASITNSATGDFTYTPDAGFVGTDVFVFQVSDGVTAPSQGTVTVKVTGPDFGISTPSPSATVTRGSTLFIEIDIGRTGGFTDAVTVTGPQLTAAGLRLRPASITTKSSSAVFKLKVKDNAATGPLSLTFTGRDSAGQSRATAITVTIE